MSAGDELKTGARVVVSWTGEHRIGYVDGPVFNGTAVRGTSYVPVRFVDTGETVPDVDTRIVRPAPVLTRADELSLCDCCALVVANGDESGCRDYYGHTHAPCSVPFHTVMDGDGPAVSPRGFTCDGCNEEQGAYANEWPAVVLA